MVEEEKQNHSTAPHRAPCTVYRVPFVHPSSCTVHRAPCTLLSLFAFFALFLSSCSSPKNTASTRWYHSFNTKYNVYFNGDQAYQQAFNSQQDGYVEQENYSGIILMFPVSSLPKEKQDPGGPFDKAIEKSVKAIKTHSIQTKPEKNQGKRNNPKYQEFISRKEYNPFLYKAWLMMAKSQFHNGDFLQAASSFSYISRLYTSQPSIAGEADIWKARSYGEMDWYFEAEDILSKVDQTALNKEQKHLFAATKADLFLKQKQYREALPYLQTAVQSEKNKLQKTREKYLLGQIYGNLGERELAYKTFGEVNSRHAPYILEFSAKIRQTEVYLGKDTTKVTKQLRKMAKSSKNKDYLDQVYYALGNIYMSVPDTSKAIASYEKGVKESTLNGIPKALNQIKLGDIYFERRKYVPAQPNYSEALSQLKKEDADYPRVSKRSEVLDELIVHYEAVELQDSLLRLSKMSDEERLVIVNKIIEDLIKKEEEEKKNAERDEFLAKRDENATEFGKNQPRGGLGTVSPPVEAGSFYFYNPQVVSVGKNNFQQKWGRRKLEDNWRRRNKVNPMEQFDNENTPNENELPNETELIAENDSISENTAKSVESSNDPKDPQFYLQQIPVTEEDIEAANLIISDGLYNMAIIYKDKLEDAGLALETFNTLDTRYPENENKLMAYYHTYLIYLRKGDMEMANQYKRKIIEAFPESDYAIAMADPDYEYNMRMMDVVQDSLYRDTYEAYLRGDSYTTRKNYEEILSKYAQSKLMPKFMFLNALSYVQTQEADTFKNQLKELISKYPDADVSVLAAEMMKGFQRGLSLSAGGDGMLVRGGLFNIRFIGEDGELTDAESLTFAPEINVPHKLLLIYPKGSLNDNLLLYTVASYNFGNFKINDFDLEQTVVNDIAMLQIKGFHNLSEVMQYIQLIEQPDGYIPNLQNSVVVVPVSLENYTTLMKGKSLEEYMTFFEQNFGKNNQRLIDEWKLKQEEEATKEVEEAKIEKIEKIEEVEEVEEIDLEDFKNLKEEEIATQAVDSIATKTEEERLKETINDVYNQASDGLENVKSIMNEISSDPVRGLLNLFKKRKTSNPIDEYVKEQEKAEKEHQKQLKKEKEEKEKVEKEKARQEAKEQKALLKKQQKEEKALLKAKAEEEKEQERLKKAEKKAKEDEKIRLKKEKEDAQKKKQAEYKAKQKQKEQERKDKEKAREAERKQKEKERKIAKEAKKKK